VRLHVADLAAGRAGERVEGADLVEDVIGQLGGRAVQEAASRQGWAVPGGSPAWKPHATLAEETEGMMAASSPIVHEPKDSPTSEFRSICGA